MTATLSSADVIAAIEAEDVRRVVELFQGREEAERRRVAPEVIAWFGGAFPDVRLAKRAGPVAMLACATLSEIQRRRLVVGSGMYRSEGAEVLIERRPPWLDALVAEVFERNRWGGCFVWARRLYRAGVIRRPESDGYILAAIDGILALSRTIPGTKTWADVVRSDPELLTYEVWRLFEVEGRPREASLTSHGAGWLRALMQLVDTGDVSRSRLIDATLGALSADFSAYNMRWYFDLYKQLDPTEAERRERAERYLRLLHSREPTVVKFGVTEVAALVPSGCMDPDAVADAVGALLPAAPQATSLAALKLLGQAAVAGPSAVRAAAEGLANRSASVQRAALDIAAAALTDEDEEGAALLRAYAGLISPALQDRLVEIAGTSSRESPAPSPAGVTVDLSSLAPAFRAMAGVDEAVAAAARGMLPPRVNVDRMRIPPPAPELAITPILETQELIQVLGHLIESADDPAEIERALDGLARSAGERPDDLREQTGPLRKRALQLTKRRPGPLLLENVLCHLVLAWTDEAVSTSMPWSTEPGLADHVNGRMMEVAKRLAAGAAAPLLAMPTHAGGWIDAEELAHRVVAAEQQHREPDILDAVQSLLRLSPWHRAEALELTTAATGGLGRALRFALDGVAPAAGTDGPLWIAARRARDPYGHDEPDGPLQFLLKGDTTGQMSLPDVTYLVVESTRTPPSGVPTTSPSELAIGSVSGCPDLYTGPMDSGRRWVAWVWPLGMEANYASALGSVSRYQDWDEDDGVLLEPLLDPDQPFGKMAAALVWVALGTKSAGTGAAGSRRSRGRHR
jgi:hypothetical protein